MSTITIDAPKTTRPELIAFNQRAEEIASLAEQYLPLKIHGLEDRKGYELVHAARMNLVKFRTAIEAKRKELKADSLEYGRQVDAAAKVMTAQIAPIEAHLEAEESVVIAERDRVKREAELAKAAALQKRMDALAEAGATINSFLVEGMTEPQFAETLAKAQEAKAERERLAEAERQRIAAEAEARRLEAEALAKERAELAAQRKAQEAEATAFAERQAAITRQQEAEAARIRAEQQKLIDAENAQNRIAEMEQARKEAAEKSRIETEQRLADEARRKQDAAEKAAAKAKADADAKERKRAKEEAKRPYREKLEAVAAAVEAIEVPRGPGDDDVTAILRQAAIEIRAIAAGELE